MLLQSIDDAAISQGVVLLVDKPIRWTSFDVINKIKYTIRCQSGCAKFKIGHAGTLDPLASGLLIVCIGQSTKQISEIQAQEKQYEGTFTLGATTASYDLEKTPENFMPYNHLSSGDILSATRQLTGTIQQRPPLFSAVKINGKRAFDYARENKEVVIQPKEVTVYSFLITRMELPEIDFKIRCSKGTYIRSLAQDLGELMGCGAYLSRLRRTQIGNYSIENALDMKPFLHSRTAQDRSQKRDFEL
jgi:tRNA pseudouridine55 synthase